MSEETKELVDTSSIDTEIGPRKSKTTYCFIQLEYLKKEYSSYSKDE